MRAFAQTNIQLYNQMRAEEYSTEDIAQVAEAYHLAVDVCGSLMRGSGKTLLSHLVGTASILAWLGQPTRTISAGLLHAAYEDGDFGLRRARQELIDRVGPDVEAILAHYRELRWQYDEDQVRQIASGVSDLSELERASLLIRVANELEDNLDLAPLYHGGVGDSTDIKKSAAWRVDYASRIERPLSDLARALGEPGLASCISDHLEEVALADVPEDLRTGYRNIWLAAPRTGSVGRRLRQPVRLLASARRLGVQKTLQRARARALR